MLASLKKEHQEAMQGLRLDHQQNIKQLEADRNQRMEELSAQHQQEQGRLQQALDALTVEHQKLQQESDELKATISQLETDIKEAKLNNMFSVSKSGEKLIRVVRSVQELASELDETSRTVTDGEYSFFDEIKDKRDRETVLSLTGSSTIDANEIEVESEPAEDQSENTEPQNNDDETTSSNDSDPE